MTIDSFVTRGIHGLQLLIIGEQRASTFLDSPELILMFIGNVHTGSSNRAHRWFDIILLFLLQMPLKHSSSQIMVWTGSLPSKRKRSDKRQECQYASYTPSAMPCALDQLRRPNALWVHHQKRQPVGNTHEKTGWLLIKIANMGASNRFWTMAAVCVYGQNVIPITLLFGCLSRERFMEYMLRPFLHHNVTDDVRPIIIYTHFPILLSAFVYPLTKPVCGDQTGLWWTQPVIRVILSCWACSATDRVLFGNLSSLDEKNRLKSATSMKLFCR